MNIEHLPQNRMRLPKPPAPGMSGGNHNSDLDRILDPTNKTEAAVLNFLGFGVQTTPEEAFYMGDFLKLTPYFDPFNLTKEPVYDPGLWPNYAPPVPQEAIIENGHPTNLDYFSLGEELIQIVAPSQLTINLQTEAPPQFTNTTNLENKKPSHLAKTEVKTEVPATPKLNSPKKEEPKTAPGQTPKKRGRKRKQLDAEGQKVERTKFLERNRQAADKCRLRKKEYIAKLDSTRQDLSAENHFLKEQMDQLSAEAIVLRAQFAMECGCDEDTIERNLREQLKMMGVFPLKIEGDVGRFWRLKAQGVAQVGPWEASPRHMPLPVEEDDMICPSTRFSSSRSQSVFSNQNDDKEDSEASSSLL